MSNSTTKKFSPVTLPPQTSKSSFWQPPTNDVQPQSSRFQAEEDSAGWQVPPNMGIENNLIRLSLQGSIQPKCETCAAEEKEPQPEQKIQTKLTVGAPCDPYEQEADRVAAKVMAMSDNAPQVQRFGEAKTPIQMWSLAQSITPVVQRQVDEQVQMRQLVQRAFQGGGTQASGGLESRLSGSKGGGSALAPSVRAFMEPRFGADFSGVRVHTGGDAVQMNRELGAQAFTHGSDVYFGEGKSPGNNELTAHELTHVVQQTGAVQRQPTTSPKASATHPTLKAPCFAGEPTLEACNNGEQNKYLRPGSKGIAVKKVQKALLTLGFKLPKFGADGKFGGETAEAVSQFKRQKNITPSDGVVGIKTIGALDKESAIVALNNDCQPGGGQPTPTPPTPPKPPKPPKLPPVCKTPTNPDLSSTTFNPTTIGENAVALRHPIDGLRARIDASTALSAAEASVLLGIHLGPADAFRHCLWNCLMTQHIGATRAEQFATGHENSGPSSIPFDNQMDLHDNATGRNLGIAGANCQDACMKAVTSGQLRTIRRPPLVPKDCIGASDQSWP